MWRRFTRKRARERNGRQTMVTKHPKSHPPSALFVFNGRLCWAQFDRINDVRYLLLQITGPIEKFMSQTRILGRFIWRWKQCHPSKHQMFYYGISADWCRFLESGTVALPAAMVNHRWLFTVTIIKDTPPAMNHSVHPPLDPLTWYHATVPVNSSEGKKVKIRRR
jgi:hypothetical protein